MLFTGKDPRVNAKSVETLGVLSILVLLALLVSGCTTIIPQKALGAEATVAGQPAPVQVVEVTRGSMVSALTYTGDVKPKVQINLFAKTLGRIEELHVDVGSEVRAGELIGSLERTGLEAQVKQAEAAAAMARARVAQMEAGTRPETIAQAQAGLDSARERYAAMLEGGRGESVAQAESALRSAEARLAQLSAGPTLEIAQAEAAARAAKNQLYAVQAQADSAMSKMGSGYTPDMKEANSGAAYEQINVAEARLAELRAGPTQGQLDQVQAAVDQARAALELVRKPFTDRDIRQAENAVVAAEQQLRLAENPFTKADFEAARAPVAQAQANVEFVKAQLADTDIAAPVDGVVAEKHLSVGALASPQAPILTIISTDLEVALSIEETRAGQVGLGQPVSLAVAAYPGKNFAGTISSVAPAVDTRTRAFAVKISVVDEEAKLKAGMLAKVSINLEKRDGVAMVPEQAVIKRGSENSVFTVVDGKARLRKIETGASDGKNVEIKSGLEVGEKVIVGNATFKDGDPVAWE